MSIHVRDRELRVWIGTALLLSVGLWSPVGLAYGQDTTPTPTAAEEVKRLNEKVVEYDRKGEEQGAFATAKRALEMAEKRLDPTHPATAAALTNLADLYCRRGNYDSAEPLYQRALEIREQTSRSPYFELAQSLNNLGILAYQREDYTSAVRLLQRALAIYENAATPPLSAFTQVLNNLGAVYQAERDYMRAEDQLTRALKLRMQMFGESHPAVAQSFNNLGMLYYVNRDYIRAEDLLHRALAIAEQTLGKTSLATIQYRSNLGMLYAAKGNVTQAIPLLAEAAYLLEIRMAPLLAAGTEREKQAYMEMFTSDTEAVVSFHARFAPNDPGALRLALTTVLRRKGRVLDAMADTLATVRRHLRPQDAVLLGQLTGVWSQLASLDREGPHKKEVEQYQAQMTRLHEQRRTLEEAVSARSAEFRLQMQPLTLDQVQAAIPVGAALVEFVAYRPFLPQAENKEERWGPRRYAAYVLRREGDPSWTDLGEARLIDRGIARLHGALSSADRGDVKKLARALDEQMMRPIRTLLGTTHTVLLCPDGALHLVPFGALVDEGDRYLLETFTFTYLTAGRDLLRLRERSPLRAEPLVIANPTFGEAENLTDVRGEQPRLGPEVQRSVDWNRARFRPLPGTAEEAKALQRLLPGATVLTETAATKAALMKARGPRIVHVATHGFFMNDPKEVVLEKEKGEVELSPGSRPARKLSWGIPLLRSGLAFAAVNRQQGQADGILTALEAAGLDLWGTRLIVLSACETGMGDVRSGEGVYGLRRAMVIAGAETQVMSLWKVADEATRNLMVEYYRRLLSGEGRTEALRHAQLSMLHSKRSHPFYWASFIVSGNWTPLDGLE